MFYLLRAATALALTIFTQQAPPETSTITPTPSPEAAAEAEAGAEATTAAPPPAGAPLPGSVDPRLAHRLRLAPLIAGAVVFGVSYAVAVFLGLAYPLACVDSSDPDCGSQAKPLFIPLAGPVLAAINDDLDVGWPALAALSVAQIAGAAMLIYGAVGESVPRKRPRLRAPVTFAPIVSPTALGLAFNGFW